MLKPKRLKVMEFVVGILLSRQVSVLGKDLCELQFYNVFHNHNSNYRKDSNRIQRKAGMIISFDMVKSENHLIKSLMERSNLS